MPEPQLIDPPYPFDGGKYVLNALVGEGSGGTRVYRARSTAGDIVAIKVIPRAFGGEARRRQKNYFEREVVAGRRLQYPQVRKLIATGEVERTKLPGALDDLLYLVFEFVDGVSVRDRLEASGFEPPEVRDLTFRVSLGLGMAHATGLIHRDVKPENILLPDGDVLRAKVADFGISRASEVTAVTTGIGIGTATYMAPEQFRDSSSVTQAADIYSLGLVIWECLTGAVPYGCEDPMATMEARLRAAPLGDLQRHGMKCPELSVVLRKALAKSPEGRYESILQMADAVVHAGAGDGIWEPQIREAVARGSDEAASFDAEEIDDQMSEPGEYEEDAEPDEYEVSEEHWADGSFESSAGVSRRGRSREPNEAFMKAMRPSATLAAVVGSSPLPRTQVTKKLWAYIRRNGLQDKKNRRMINADAKLRPIFKRDQVSMFEMTKLVSEHLS